MGGRQKKFIYRLRQASRQWYLKFWFNKNEQDNCIYPEFKNGKYIFLILYVDDILLSSKDIDLLLEKKKFLSSSFDMNDLGELMFAEIKEKGYQNYHKSHT